MKRSPTVADVARLAGVSTATVSRCLNAPGTVRPGARAKVDSAIAELGYVPDGAARALASRRAGTIGAVVPTLENSIFAKGIHSLQNRLAAAANTLLLASSNYSLDQEEHEIRTLVSRGVDGLVLIGTSHRAPVYELLRRKSIPYVNTWTFDPRGPHPCVGFDNRQVAGRIARYLLDLGHRRIAMISGVTLDNDRASERVAGVERTMSDQGLLLQADWLIERPYSIVDGRTAFHHLMSSGPRPSAVICGNDVLALGAVFEAEAMGVDVPGDVSITGFDDLELASHISPSLTTARVPVEHMGIAAADYLISRISGRTFPERTELEVQLVVRETTGRAPDE